MKATEIRKGNVIRVDNVVGTVIDLQHRTPGNKRGFVQVKYRDIESGNMHNAKISSTDEVERIILDKRSCQYLYPEADAHVFMDNETYEQFPLPQDLLEGSLPYLVDNATVDVMMLEGRPVSVELPANVTLTVSETVDVARGDTTGALSKDATLETGLVVKVPAHIKTGDRVRIKTDSGEFLEREK